MKGGQNDGPLRALCYCVTLSHTGYIGVDKNRERGVNGKGIFVNGPC
jgi:hypothetical protein